MASRWLALSAAACRHLTRCVGIIDRALAQNAKQKGAPLAGVPGLRFYVAPPIPKQTLVGVVFEAKPDDRKVRVLQLRELPPRT